MLIEFVFNRLLSSMVDVGMYSHCITDLLLDMIKYENIDDGLEIGNVDFVFS